jgi:hypothetical protein
VAVPLESPPDAEQDPASTSAGVAASLTGSGPVIELQVPGASHEPPGGEKQPLTAGDPMVHAPADGVAHWHGEHPRWSSTPASAPP